MSTVEYPTHKMLFTDPSTDAPHSYAGLIWGRDVKTNEGAPHSDAGLIWGRASEAEQDVPHSDAGLIWGRDTTAAQDAPHSDAGLIWGRDAEDIAIARREPHGASSIYESTFL